MRLERKFSYGRPLAGTKRTNGDLSRVNMAVHCVLITPVTPVLLVMLVLLDIDTSLSCIV
jgi:hypothetical protein